MKIFLSVLISFFLICLASSSSWSVVMLDGTLGRSGPVSGPNYQITADLGRQVGTNLFHSFQTFNVNTGESATFSGPAGIGNILSRVTGGTSSWIDGLLRSTINGANLYLINPSGVMFGPNASLDISGSFHVSTADYLKLGQDGFFYATTPEKSVLTSFPPSAFGFLNSNPAGISFDQPWIIVPDGKTISVIGGNLKLDNTLLYAPGGKVYLASVASAGEVSLNDTGINMTGFTNLGSIALTRTADYIYDSGIYVSPTALGKDGGAVYIRGGEFKIVGETIDASTAGANPGGGISIKVTGDMVIDSAGVPSGGALLSYSYSAGRAGDVNIEAKNLTMTKGTISTDTYASGNAGTININATGSVKLTNGDTEYGNISSNSMQAAGNAGTINITAPNLTVDDSSIQASQQFISKIGWGNAGVINLNLGTLNLLNNGRIATSNFGGGKAGTINITASDSIVMDGGVIYNQSLLGQNGNIGLDTAHLTLKGWSEISNTSTLGSGGNISIKAADANIGGFSTISTNSIDGLGLSTGNINLNIGSLDINTRASIDASASGSTNAGNISITSNNLTVQSGAAIIDTSETGAGGNINITATDASVSGFATKYDGTKLFSTIQTGTFDGTSGTVQMDVGALNISNGAKLDASSMGSGKAGDIIISAKNAVTVAGGNILSNTYFGGDGGNISITSPSLVLQDKGWIMAGSHRTGNAGNITLNVDTLSVNSGSITTDSFGGSQGGNIKVTAIGAVNVTGSDSSISTGTSGDGRGGDLYIKAGTLSLSNDASINAGALGNGNSGDIKIEVGTLNISGNSNINASTATFFPDNTIDPSGKGNAGNVNITATDSVNITGGGAILTSSLNAGNCGDITISSPVLALQDKGYILATTAESGKGGNVNIKADKVSVVNTGISTAAYKYGMAGNISITSGVLNIDNLGTVDSGTYGSGKSGNITINTGSLSLTNGGYLGAFTYGTGPAGLIDITARDSVSVTGKSGDVLSRITVQSYFEGSGGGNGGNLTVNTPLLNVADEGIVSASTLGDGNAGNVILKIGTLNVSNKAGIYSKTYKEGQGGLIDITASGYVNINGGQINTSSEGSGNGGSISMQMDNLQMDSGALISAKGTGTGTGGNITLKASDSISLLNSSFITTETLKSDGGNIEIRAPQLVYLFGSSITTSVQGGLGNGGNITIDPQFVILNNSNIIANAYGGNGGNISIFSDYFFASPDSIVQASSQLGISGTINITAPYIDLSGSLAVLPSNYLDATSLMRDRCVALSDEKTSSLILVGRGGMPTEPDDYLPSP